MVHPSKLAIEYIFERFKENCISKECYEQMSKNLKRSKSNKHIPLELKNKI